MKECWYKNTTSYDLNLNDLGIRILANKAVNLYRLRPTLTAEMIKRSEQEGLLAKCINFKPYPKLIRLPCEPPVNHKENQKFTIKEAKTPIPSRVKTSVLVDPKEKDYIEDMDIDNLRLSDLDLSKYDDYSNGLVDPMEGASGVGSNINSVPISTSKENAAEAPRPKIDAPANKNKYFTVESK